MITIKLANSKKYATIQGDLFDDIREHFSVKNEAAKHTKRFNPFVPNRLYAITPSGRFEVGLYDEIYKYILSKNYSGTIDCNQSHLQYAIKPAPYVWGIHPKYNNDEYPLNIKLRDYQKDIVDKCLEYGRGTVVLATAGGKTLTMASLISKVQQFYDDKFKCLLIVPDRGLVEQTYNDMLSYGVPFSVSRWTGDDDLNLGAKVIIANLGILQSKNTNLNWIEFADLLIVDETHKIKKGNAANDIISKIRTPFKFGVTGTLPENLLDQWNIFGKMGQVLYERNSFQLRQDHFVSDVQAKIINVHYNNVHFPVNVNSISAQYRAEMDYIANSKFRNLLITKLSNQTTNNCLILIDYISHGQVLESVCKENCPTKQVYFIQGIVEIEDREKIKQLMEQNTNVVVVAISKIFSTGINIKNLHYIIFAGGGKAKIKTIQSIGRGLRLHASKTQLTLIDIADQLKYGKQHAIKRQDIYKNENISQTTYSVNDPN